MRKRSALIRQRRRRKRRHRREAWHPVTVSAGQIVHPLKPLVGQCLSPCQCLSVCLIELAPGTRSGNSLICQPSNASLHLPVSAFLSGRDTDYSVARLGEAQDRESVECCVCTCFKVRLVSEMNNNKLTRQWGKERVQWPS